MMTSGKGEGGVDVYWNVLSGGHGGLIVEVPGKPEIAGLSPHHLTYFGDKIHFSFHIIKHEGSTNPVGMRPGSFYYCKYVILSLLWLPWFSLSSGYNTKS